jgi:serine/threonine protein kinase
VLHRDIKPANIMLPKTGGVKVTDFGIAQVLGAARLTREGRMVGTLEYLAPERILGKPFDERSDLYSAGVVFYEMLSGHLPFEADTDYALIRAQTEAPPPPIQNFGVNVPQPLIEVLWRSLAKAPEQRYPNAGAMAAALKEARAQAEAMSPVAPPPPQYNQPRETRLSGGVPTPPFGVPAAGAPTPPFGVPAAYSAPPAAQPAPAAAKASTRAMWAVGALVAVIVLGSAAVLAVRTFSSPTDNKPKEIANVTPDPGAPGVAKPREPIIPVGPAVEINDGRPASTPSPAPGRTNPPTAPPTAPPAAPPTNPGRTPVPQTPPPQNPQPQTPAPQTPVVVTPPVTPPSTPAAPPAASNARGAIGVRGVFIAGQAAVTLQLPAAGLLIQEVQRGSGAEAAGLRGPSNSIPLPSGGTLGIGGDLITAIDGAPIQGQQSPALILAYKHPGDPVTLTVVRGGRFMNVPMRLGEGTDATLQQLTQIQSPTQPTPAPNPQVNPQPSSPAAPTVTGQRIEVIHDHGGMANTPVWPACRGYLQTVGNELVYLVTGTDDGRNDNFRIPLSEVQEVKANVLPIRQRQAFHVKIGGKSFNFVPTSTTPLLAVSEIQRAMRH